MSIINNVLKDLEGKTSQFTPIHIASVDKLANTTTSNRSAFVLSIAMIVFISLALLAWYLFPAQSEISQAETLTTIEEQASALELEAGEVSVAVVEPRNNQIIGLQFRESESEMSLEFSLRDKVVSYLKERSEDSFVYRLKDIESQIVAPLMVGNRWIKQLSILPVEQGVDIHFQTATGILVETRQQQVNDEQIWTIKLKNKIVVATVALEPKNQLAVTGSIAAKKEALLKPVEIISPAIEEQPAPALAVKKPIEKLVKLDITSTDDNSKTIGQLEYSTSLIKSGRIAEAETLLLSLLAGSEELKARRQLLGLYAGQRLDTKFARMARASMLRFPEQSIFKTEYARSLFQASAYRSLIQLFALAENDSNASLQSLLAASFQRLDQHQNAIKHYQLALAQNGRNAKYWIGLAISQEHSSALTDALASYRTASRLGQLSSRMQAFVEKRSKTLEQVLN